MAEKPTYEELEQKVLELEKAQLERRIAEEALRESETRYRELFVSNPHPMWVYDLESLAFLDVNNAAISHYGYSREEFLSKTIKDIRPPEDVPRLLNNVDRVSNGLDKAGIWRHIKKDGSIIDVEITSHVLQFEKRRAEMVLVSDITERKTAEETMRRYEQIISSTNDLMSFVDKNYVYQAANNAYLKAHAKKREEIVGASVEHLLGTEAFQKVAKVYLDRALAGERVQYQSWFEYVGIGRRFMDVTYHPFKDDQGEISGVVVGVHDLTERKRAEETLHLSLEKFEKAFNAAPIWVVLSFLEDGRYLEVNETFLKTMGYKRKDVIGKTSLELNTWIDRRDRDRIVARVREMGGIRNAEVQRKTRSGAIIDTLFSAETLSLEGKPVMISVTQEITAQRKTEAEREKLQAQLLQAQKMESVGRLAGGVAHDFNNMLGVIQGRAEMILKMMKPGEPHYKDLEEIHKAARGSADLTRQLLAFARKQSIAPKVLNLNDTMEGMLKMLRRLIGEDIDLTWLPGANLWPIKVDPAQIDQILANVGVNARDAISGTGKVTIETENVVIDEAYCTAHAGFKPGDYVLLSISDNGCGMDKETLENIFEPFFTTKEVGEGTGLGLATTYGIVKQNEGFISVYSEPNQGTTFKIYLPRTSEDIQEKPGLPTEPVAKGNETVLMVEDEESLLRLGRRILEEFGYTVLATRMPAKALAIAERHEGPIHLLVTDVVMPEMNGKELMGRIEKIKPQIKVLFMSGYTGNVIANRGILEDEVNFLPKPFSVNSLAAKVRKVLDQ